MSGICILQMIKLCACVTLMDILVALVGCMVDMV